MASGWRFLPQVDGLRACIVVHTRRWLTACRAFGHLGFFTKRWWRYKQSTFRSSTILWQFLKHDSQIPKKHLQFRRYVNKRDGREKNTCP